MSGVTATMAEQAELGFFKFKLPHLPHSTKITFYLIHHLKKGGCLVIMHEVQHDL